MHRSVDDVATVEDSLRLGDGLEPAERVGIVSRWGSLDARLRSFRSGTVDLRVSVKERDTASQRVILEAWIAGRARIVATSRETDVERALTEVRDDLIRQLTDAKNKTEPRNNRRLRTTPA